MLFVVGVNIGVLLKFQEKIEFFDPKNEGDVFSTNSRQRTFVQSVKLSFFGQAASSTFGVVFM